MAREFKLANWTKVRPLKHLAKGAIGPDGKPVDGAAGEYLNSKDLIDDSGNVDVDLCKRYDLDPSLVSHITTSDFDSVYQGSDGMAMLTAYAVEQQMDADDLLVELIITSKGQDAYADAMRQLRPKTDKQINKAWRLIADAYKFDLATPEGRQKLMDLLASRA